MSASCQQHRRIGHCKKIPIQMIAQVALLHMLRILTGLSPSLMIVVCTIALDSRSVSVTYLRPDSVNPDVAYATTPLDYPAAEPPPFSLPIYAFWPILGRPFSLAMALISALFVGSSLRRPGDHPTQHDAWYQVINQHIAERIRPAVDKYQQAFPTLLEIPSKDHPYDPSKA
ncbi:hypothetical protein F5888DRAFT_1003114 [Russula emetica]|nr:hypothetical protein F5888DRAFT_1003114 [Russula emetica]